MPIRDSMFSAAAWAMVGVGKPEPEPEEEDASIWPFILLSIIIALSTVFDCGKEMVEHTTPETFQPIVEAFFSELATLGFIGALAFLLTYNFSSSCEGACSIMQQISEHFLDEPDELQEIFEKLHFLLFAVSVVFIAVVLVLLRISLRSGRIWLQWENEMKKTHDDLKTNTAVFEAKEACMEARRKMVESVNAVQSLMADQPDITKRRSWWNSPDSLWFEWIKPNDQLRAEYYRIRHRFVDDEDEIVETQMDPDFDFHHYLKLSLAHTFAEVIEIKPVDWLVLWLGFAVVFVLYFLEPAFTVSSFLVCELIVLLLCFATQAKLVRIRYNLLPSVDITSTQASVNDLHSLVPLDDDSSEHSPLLRSSPMGSRERSDKYDLMGPQAHHAAAITPGAGASADQLMGHDHDDAALLASPAASPNPSPPPRTSSGGNNSRNNSPALPAFSNAPPAHAHKMGYREFHHQRRGSAGDVQATQSAPMPSPRRVSIQAPGDPEPMMSRTKSDGSEGVSRVGPSNGGLTSMPIRAHSTDSNASGSGGAFASINRGKMSKKTRIMLARPRYTTLPNAASIKTAHASPAKMGSKRNLLKQDSHKLTRVASNAGEDEDEGRGICQAVTGCLRAVFCCCCAGGHGHGGHPQAPTKHHSLFWFKTRGKGFMIHMVKLLLFSSVISLAVIAVELRVQLAETSVLLLLMAIMPPALTLIMTPRNLQLLNLVTSIEFMKNETLIIEVIKTQRYEKQRKVTQILSSLQFFLDQAEALSSSNSDSGPRMDVSYQYKKLMRDKSIKSHLTDLKELFDYYDDDKSGSIDKDELGMLLGQMGQRKSPDELDRLFNLMDADCSGTVEFEEFAVVIMANRKSKRNMDPIALADRMWKLFDENGDGSIECNELSATLKRLGQNWNTDDIDTFFRDIDKDGSGAIEKDEFVDFIMENLGGRRKKAHH